MHAGPDTRGAKRRLRRDLRAARRALGTEAQAQAAEAVATHAMANPPLADARAIVAYIASDGEIDIAPLMHQLQRSGRRILLPRCLEDGSLELVVVQPGSRLLATGPGGVLEPDGPAVSLDTVPLPAALLAPAVALDRRGNRLGRGGGAYDRLIPKIHRRNWEVVGLCHGEHVVDRLPTEAHDVAVDAILTERGLVRPETQVASPGRRS